VSNSRVLGGLDAVHVPQFPNPVRREISSFSRASSGSLPGIGCAPFGDVHRDDPSDIDERSFRFFEEVLTFVDTIELTPKTNRIVE